MGSVLELHPCPTTALNVVGYHKESIFRHMSQYAQETGNFCCAKEAQSTLHNDDFFKFRSIRAASICQVSLISQVA